MSTNCEVFPGIARVAHSFKGVLLDAYGVFWNGNECGLLPGAKESMEKLVLGGKVVGILSNSTQLSSKEIAKLERHGLHEGKHFHFMTTSGDIAREFFLNDTLPFETVKNKFWLFGGTHPRFSSHEQIFQGSNYSETLDIDEADFIYISVPHIEGEDQVDRELFRKKVENIKNANLPMICTNPDQFAHEGNPSRAVVRQGSIAMLYEQMGGTVYYIGKPSAKAYSAAMHVFEKYSICSPVDVLMVGDTPETDIRGARRFGMRSALVTETGIMAERIASCGLKDALNALSLLDSPDYFIGRLIDDL